MNLPFLPEHILISFLLGIAQFLFLCLQFPQACDLHLAALVLGQYGRWSYASHITFLYHKVRLHFSARPTCALSLLRALLSPALFPGTVPSSLCSSSNSWRTFLPPPSLLFLVTDRTLYNPMDCSTSGSSVHENHQARILQWVAISFSRESSRPRDRTFVYCIVCLEDSLLHGFIKRNHLPPTGETKNARSSLFSASPLQHDPGHVAQARQSEGPVPGFDGKLARPGMSRDPRERPLSVGESIADLDSWHSGGMAHTRNFHLGWLCSFEPSSQALDGSVNGPLEFWDIFCLM